ncbi:V-type proton ATPase subunit e [Plakobranchus ocellatus]|uniref:V-type proton ATPase subunit e n=1 Tax=Plakobranchus ocellatus TaxID=259542 RepID=A0AAV3XYV6_9GAST|nr:V-type proton ATPase subunit e [Plakobranchus ocellatus]
MAGMSDAEVQGQIAHMIAFIEQEASEKVEEIECKAEEEFNLEKGRLVTQARTKIIEHFDKKIKQVELQKKIQHSNLLNASRLQVLKHKERLVNNLFETISKDSARVSSDDPKKYKQALSDLTLQALCRVLEPNVTVQVRQQDLQLMKSLLPGIKERYTGISQGKYQVEIAIDEQNFLPSDLIGGIVLTAQGGKITINNTLDERLKHIGRQMQPQIREMLFGPNPNRTFMD